MQMLCPLFSVPFSNLQTDIGRSFESVPIACLAKADYVQFQAYRRMIDRFLFYELIRLLTSRRGGRFVMYFANGDSPFRLLYRIFGMIVLAVAGFSDVDSNDGHF